MSVATGILEVFTSVTIWFADAVSSIQPMFWNAETGLTFLGVLAAIGVSIAVTLMIVNFIKSFIQLH